MRPLYRASPSVWDLTGLGVRSYCPDGKNREYLDGYVDPKTQIWRDNPCHDAANGEYYYKVEDPYYEGEDQDHS